MKGALFLYDVVVSSGIKKPKFYGRLLERNLAEACARGVNACEDCHGMHADVVPVRLARLPSNRNGKL